MRITSDSEWNNIVPQWFESFQDTKNIRDITVERPIRPEQGLLAAGRHHYHPGFAADGAHHHLDLQPLFFSSRPIELGYI